MVSSFVFFIESPHRTGCAVRRIKEKSPMKWAFLTNNIYYLLGENLVVYA